jgi:hypothetical protein
LQYLELLNIFENYKNHDMKKLATAALLIGILALGSCASSKPCPAYAKASSSQNANS